MKLVGQPKIILSDKEKNTLYDAADILKKIVDALENNKEQGFTSFQEGLDARRWKHEDLHRKRKNRH